MAISYMNDAKIIFGSYNYSGDMNEVKVTLGADMLEKTVFGNTEHQFTRGMTNFEAEANGFIQFDDASTPKAVDYQLATEMLAANSVARPFTIAYGAEGSTAYLGRGFAGDYSPSLTPTGLGTFSFKIGASHQITRGALLVEPSTRSGASGNGGIVQLGALSATQKMIACLHVLQFNGTTLSVTLNSNDTNNTTTPTSRIAFTAATGVGSEFKETAVGAITDTYWYVSWTFTGTNFKAAVSAGIR